MIEHGTYKAHKKKVKEMEVEMDSREQVSLRYRLTQNLLGIIPAAALFWAGACSAQPDVGQKKPAGGFAAVAALCSGDAGLDQGFGVESITPGLQLKWPGEPGLEYIVYWTKEIGNPDWQEIGRTFCRSIGELSFFDAERPQRQGFYRIERTRAMVLSPGSDGGGVEYDYHIGKYEVTNAEFALFLSADESHLKYWGPGALPAVCEYMKILQLQRYKIQTRLVFVPVPGWEDHPVTCVSWEGAAAYCNWLSEREGLEKVYDESAGWMPDITKSGYRLPTAEEWYKAAGWDPTKDGVGGFWKYGCRSDTIRNTEANHQRGGDPYGGGGYADGPEPPGFEPVPRCPETTPVGYYNGSSHLLYRDGDSSYFFTTEDGRSYYGCYDMSGNVSEYVSRSEGETWERRGRMGDSWANTHPSDWDLADFEYHGTSEGASVCGFRLARTRK